MRHPQYSRCDGRTDKRMDDGQTDRQTDIHRSTAYCATSVSREKYRPNILQPKRVDSSMALADHCAHLQKKLLTYLPTYLLIFRVQNGPPVSANNPNACTWGSTLNIWGHSGPLCHALSLSSSSSLLLLLWTSILHCHSPGVATVARRLRWTPPALHSYAGGVRRDTSETWWMVMRRAAVRCGEWAQHFSNASCVF